MSVSVTMPQLGERVRGHRNPLAQAGGDEVEADEPLLEVSTDKVDTEIPSPAAGVPAAIKVREDETVEVGSRARGDRRHAREGRRRAAEGAAARGAGRRGRRPGRRAGRGPSRPSLSPQPAPGRAAAGAGSPPRSRLPSSRRHPPAGGRPSGGPARARRERDRGHRDPLAEAGGRPGRGGRAAARGLHRQGRHRDPLPAAGSPVDHGEDETVAVGTELAVIGGAEAGAAARQPASPRAGAGTPAARPRPRPASGAPARRRRLRPEAAPAARPRRRPRPAAPTGAGEPSGDGAYVTPLVRKLATEHGVDLSSLRGTGVGGRIRKQDVLEAARGADGRRQAAAGRRAAAPGRRAPLRPGPAPPSPLRGRTEKMSRLRTVIAKRMVESLQMSAQLTTVVEVDVTKIARLRRRPRPTSRARGRQAVLPAVLRAGRDRGAQAAPQLNASIDTETGEVTYHDAEHLGIAVDTERGLLVPVIKNAGDLNLAGWPARSPTWPSVPANKVSRTSWPAARSR